MVHTIEEAAIVMVRFRGYDTHAVVSQPRFLVINGRTFLSGDVPKDAFPGFDGKRVLVAWEEIQEMFTFETEEAYQSAIGQWRKRHKRGWLTRLLWPGEE